MAIMATVAPSGLGMFASGSFLSVKQSVRRTRARSCPVRTTCCSSTDVSRLIKDASKHSKSGAERSVETTKGLEVAKALAPITASAAFFLQAAGPALAEVAPVEMVDDSQYWWEVLLTSGACGFIYLLVIPAIIYNYLRLRWYKRSALETYFQFMLVFVFFPGLLLLAPFINFRRLPKEGTEAP